MSFFRPLSKLVSIKAIRNQLYIAGEDGFYHLDINMNTVKTFSNPAAGYRRIYYNQTNGQIYVAGFILRRIDVFDLNLTFLKSISTNNMSVYVLTGYLNSIYVGTSSGDILVIQNENVIFTYFSVCNNLLVTLKFDTNGYMYALCYSPDNILKVFYINGANTGISLYALNALTVSIDSKGRMVIFRDSALDIYY